MVSDPDQMNVDDFMREQLEAMRQQIEPAAVDLEGCAFSGMVNYSIAISLKRIADIMMNDNNQTHMLRTGLSSLCSEVFDLKTTLKNEMASTRQSLYGISNEIRSNDGRELRITIAKD